MQGRTRALTIVLPTPRIIVEADRRDFAGNFSHSHSGSWRACPAKKIESAYCQVRCLTRYQEETQL